MREWLANFFSHPVVLLAIAGGIVRAVYWVASVNSDRSGIQDFMKEIRGDIKKIFERLPPPLAAGKSPLGLTDLGEEIANCLNAREWAKEVAPKLQEAVDGMKPFQIDEFSVTHVEKSLDEWATKIAECAYKFGRKREELPVVLRIILRDELLRLTNQSIDEDEGKQE